MIPEAEQFKSCINKHLCIDDWQALEIVLAATIAHKLKGEMLWLRIIGASGSGKTEILRAIKDIPEGYTETLETMTPAAIRRGFRPIKLNKKTEQYEDIIKEPTLLERIDGKLVITKELAPLLTRNADARLEIFGLLRSCHDGELDADYGSTQGHITQKVWFDWILGTTAYVDSQNQLEMQLGSRFTDVRWGSPIGVKDAIGKAIGNVDGLGTIRQELSAIVSSIVSHAKIEDALSFKVEDWLLDLCQVVAVMRTPVERDGYTKEIRCKPSPELGTRIGQNFSKIARGLHMLGISDIRPHLTRLAWDALPPNRADILHSILTLEFAGHKVTQEAIENNNGLGLSQSAISYIIKDLKVLDTKGLPWRDCLGFYYEKLLRIESSLL